MEETSPILATNPERGLRTTIGVWLFIITPEEEVFVVRNLKAKYASQKIPGQLNAPADTYELTDAGKFRPNTIVRTIEEEVGALEYEPSRIKPLGLIRFDNLGFNVVAAPYLIPIKNKSSLTFDPKDRTESDNPQWIRLSQITPDKTIEIGGHKVPLFRSPMCEIAELVRAHNANPNLVKSIVHVQPTVTRELITLFESNSGTQ